MIILNDLQIIEILSTRKELLKIPFLNHEVLISIQFGDYFL